MTTQIISKCAIVYYLNGLYRLINNQGVILYTGNLQECEYQKLLIDKQQSYEHINP